MGQGGYGGAVAEKYNPALVDVIDDNDSIVGAETAALTNRFIVIRNCLTNGLWPLHAC